jgi:hypothetical protein
VTGPISVDTELLNSESFQAFRRVILNAMTQYRDGDENFPLADEPTETDLQLIESLMKAHPGGLVILEALLGAVGGDSTKVDLLARVLEVAEEENTAMANFNADPGTRH